MSAVLNIADRSTASESAVPIEPLTLDSFSTALTQTSLAASATSIANELANRHCEQAVIGLRQGHSIVPIAWSGTAEIKQRSALVAQVAAAMDEAADQYTTLQYPIANDPAANANVPRITVAHARLSAAGSYGSLATIPLMISTEQGQALGAITLLRTQNHRWHAQELADIEQAATFIAPLLKLKQRSHESLWQRMTRELKERLHTLREPGRIGTKIAVLSMAVGLVALGAIPVTINASAQARLEGAVQRGIAAPLDSFVKEVFVHPGDAVNEGQLLLTLADQDLQDRQRQLESELERYRSEHAEAFALQDRVKMVIAQAKADEADAALSLVNQQIARTQITAPFAGIVIEGDLQQQIGAPIKRGETLLKLSPTTGYRIVLYVEDSDIESIRTGLRGELAVSAMPLAALHIEVERITPLASYKDGHNVYEVQARLLSSAPGLRPGLEGIAKLPIRNESLLTAGARKVFSWLRFRLWALGF